MSPPLPRTVHFEFDSSVLRPSQLAILERHADYLRETGRRVRIEGHCDERGTREYNLALGERRARAVSAFLLTNDLDGAQILEVVSYGEERPVALGSNEAAWAKNRRAEILYR